MATTIESVVSQGRLALTALSLLGPDSEIADRVRGYAEDALDALAIGGDALNAFAAHSTEAAAEVDRVIAEGGAKREHLEAGMATIDSLTERLVARRNAYRNDS